MAFRVTNNDPQPFNLPPEYGGGMLPSGQSVVIVDSQANINNGIGDANFGRATDSLVYTQVPDNTTGAIQMGGYAPAVPGNWAGRPPRTLTEAVNRLAAAIHAGALLPNTPIP